MNKTRAQKEQVELPDDKAETDAVIESRNQQQEGTLL